MVNFHKSKMPSIKIQKSNLLLTIHLKIYCNAMVHFSSSGGKTRDFSSFLIPMYRVCFPGRNFIFLIREQEREPWRGAHEVNWLRIGALRVLTCWGGSYLTLWVGSGSVDFVVEYPLKMAMINI